MDPQETLLPLTEIESKEYLAEKIYSQSLEFCSSDGLPTEYLANFKVANDQETVQGFSEEGFAAINEAFDIAKNQLEDSPNNEITNEAARLLAYSTRYEPRPGELNEALDWTQLGSQVRELFLEARQENKDQPIKPGRFLGQSEDCQKYAEFKQFIATRDSVEAPEDKITFARSVVTNFANGLKDLNPEAANLLMSGIEDEETVTSRLARIVFDYKHYAFEKSSLAHKALYVNNYLLRRSPDSDLPQPLLPWLSEVSEELIESTFDAFQNSSHEDFVKIDHKATINYLFGPDQPYDKKLGHAASYLGCERIAKAAPFIQFLKSTGEHLEPIAALGLTVCSEFDKNKTQALLDKGYNLQALANNLWLIQPLNYNSEQLFPHDGPDTIKQRWLCDNADAYLKGGWNRANIGKFISIQLENTRSLTAASEFLSAFQIPEYQDNKRLHDTQLESAYLAGIMQLEYDEIAKTPFSQKQQKIEAMFWDPANQYIYKALTSINSTGQNCTIEQLQQAILSDRERWFQELTSGDNPFTTVRLSQQEFYDMLAAALGNVQIELEEGQDFTRQDLNHMLGSLKTYGAERKNYINDATKWLLKHADNPIYHAEAWQHRSQALEAGVKDSIQSIMAWYQINSLELASGENAELVQKYRPWVQEATKYLPVSEMFDAIRECAPYGEQVALLPATTLSLRHETAPDKTFYGEVLAKSDPRGLTIGHETGCCMRWNGIENSDIFIKAGYQQPEAGFFALTNPDGRLIAQSYFYVNPDQPDTLVLDSIEANEGRDPKRTLELAQQFWSNYLQLQKNNDPNWQITKVHVGDAFTRLDFSGLTEVSAVPPLEATRIGQELKTDAKRQLLLTTASEHTNYPEARANVLLPKKDQALTFTTAKGREVLIAELEKQIYPVDIQNQDIAESVDEILSSPRAEDFSFVSFAKDDNKNPLGYCLARPIYEKDSACLKIEDLAVKPSSDAFMAGVDMFKEVLERAQDSAFDRIIFNARVSTSYRLATSPVLKERLASLGYDIVEQSAAPTKIGRESFHELTIQKVR